METTRTETRRLNGRETSFATGAMSLPPLMLHGFPNTAARGQSAPLLCQDFHCRPDQRGYGQSSAEDRTSCDGASHGRYGRLIGDNR